jgi:predicted molibdopterin-dependent oxidoreductase YjgC
MNRIRHHIILGELENGKKVKITVDGKEIEALEGEMIAAALLANGHHKFRYTKKDHLPRGIYCGIGRCTDCIMTVNGIPNVRTCVTPVEDGMVIETQQGTGSWKRDDQDV